MDILTSKNFFVAPPKIPLHIKSFWKMPNDMWNVLRLKHVDHSQIVRAAKAVLQNADAEAALLVGETVLPELGQWRPPPSAFLDAAWSCNMLFKEFLVPVPDESRDSLRNVWGTSKYPYSGKLVKFEDNLLIVRFDTAWSPPTRFFEHLTHNWGFIVSAVFFEPNMDIAGIYASEDAVILGKGYEYHVLLSELMGSEPPRHDGQRKLNACLRADGGTTLGCSSF